MAVYTLVTSNVLQHLELRYPFPAQSLHVRPGRFKEEYRFFGMMLPFESCMKASARSRVLTCAALMSGLSHAAGLYGSSGIRSISLPRAQRRSVRTGFPDSVSSTIAPCPPYDLPTHDGLRPGVMPPRSNSINPSLSQQGPNDTCHFVGERDCDEHVSRSFESFFEPQQGQLCGAAVAHSRDGDQSFQAMVITDSTDRDHAQQTLSMDAAANTTDDCICAGKVLVRTVRIARP